jgi:hypothetical protein
VRRPHPIITRDPATGAELFVTRLESPESGVSIEGTFSLGWIARLSPDQIEFVGLLLKYRNNLQKLASELGIAYNTARSRLDDIVEALGGPPDSGEDQGEPASDAVDKLATGELEYEEALEAIKRAGKRR